MRIRSRAVSAAAFTLIELLTVISIIVLLAGILVPAINSARLQAKASSTRGTMHAISQGCELFHNEFGKYPVSHGKNPFEGETSTIYLSGAQWLVLQLCGADLGGYVLPTTDNDSNGDGKIDENDWLNWYSATPTRKFSRVNPYVTATGDLAMPPKQFHKVKSFTALAPPELRDTDQSGSAGGSSDWNNGRVPFFVDKFGYPILYYVANPNGSQPVSTDLTTDPPQVGVYDGTDNVQFAGGPGGYGYCTTAAPGWDLGSGPVGSGVNYFHPIAQLGFIYDSSTPTMRPDPPPVGSFTYSIFDRNLFESTKRGSGGKVWPLQPERFILMSPGPDARWGTIDDVRSY